jgi:hypothetical protein
VKWLVIFVAACAVAAPTAPGIDVDRVVTHVHALVAVGPRPHDTPSSTQAADYIARELTAMGASLERVHVGDV